MCIRSSNRHNVNTGVYWTAKSITGAVECAFSVLTHRVYIVLVTYRWRCDSSMCCALQSVIVVVKKTLFPRVHRPLHVSSTATRATQVVSSVFSDAIFWPLVLVIRAGTATAVITTRLPVNIGSQLLTARFDLTAFWTHDWAVAVDIFYFLFSSFVRLSCNCIHTLYRWYHCYCYNYCHVCCCCCYCYCHTTASANTANLNLFSLGWYCKQGCQ